MIVVNPEAQTIEQRVTSRCMDEIARAILYLRALRGLRAADSYHAIDFIRLSFWALFDQMITHSIKVLDEREEAGFWFLVRRTKLDVPNLCATKGINIDDIRNTSNKLKHIRDKTHFHLDKRGVINPKAIWKKANVTNDEIEAMLITAFKLTSFFYKEFHSQEFGFFKFVLTYDGSDAKRIAEHADEQNLLYNESHSGSETLAAILEDRQR